MRIEICLEVEVVTVPAVWEVTFGSLTLARVDLPLELVLVVDTVVWVAI
jgi:hypothetical protein